MLRLITAVPGSGKTLYCVSLIKKLLESDDPRFIYHNIIGLNIDSPFLLPAPSDWRDVPDGSIIFYDECQEIFPSTGKAGRVDDSMLTDLETHRHRGLDIYFITQHPTFVHHHIRKLCGEHIHFYRSSGVSASVKYEWSHVCLEPNDRNEQRRANVSIFKFDKALFKLYKSTVLNTHKFKLPLKGYYYLFIIIIIIVGVFYSFRNGLNSVELMEEKNNPVVQALAPQGFSNPSPPSPAAPNLPDPSHWASSPTIPAVAGCVHFPSKKRCACYSTSGFQLSLSYAACVSAMSAPLPRNINSFISSGSSGVQPTPAPSASPSSLSPF